MRTGGGIGMQRSETLLSTRVVCVKGIGMQDNAQILGFTAGELSPWLATRHDLQAYQRGASRLENFLVQPYGGLRRRRGTRYVADAGVQGTVRLVPFSFSESDVLMLEFYPSGVRVYRDGKLLYKDGKPYEISTPWDTDEMVKELRWMQVNDIVYVLSPTFQTVMLMRHGDTDWEVAGLDPNPFPRETYLNQEVSLKVSMDSKGTYASLELEKGSFFDPNMALDEYLIADAPISSSTLFLNESYSISSSAKPDLSKLAVAVNTVFHETNSATGMYEYYTCIRAYLPANYNGSNHAKDYPHHFMPGVMRLNSNNQPYEVYGDWELRTTGEWNGIWELWRSYNTLNDTVFFREWDWTCIKSFGQDAYSTRQNYAFSGSEDIPCRMVIVCRAFKGTSVGAIMYFRMMGHDREQRYLITKVSSPTQATGYPTIRYCDSQPTFTTKKWSFGAFGWRNGYPRFAGMHQGRLWLGGTAGRPTTLYASSVGDYNDFRVRAADDAALHLTLATDDQSRICWICPMRNLLVGTSESEWTLAAPDGGSLTATNAAFSKQSAVGSENKVAYGVENTVFYVQRGGKRMREISYKLEADGYTSTDASILAEHLFTAGVKEWVVQRGNCVHLWTLMNDGSLAVLTTNPEQQVAAWQRASVPGRRVLGMAALASVGSSEDEIWFIMQNELTQHISLERLTEENDYVDGCVELTPDSGVEVSAGLHLAGLQALVYPKGEPEKAQRVQINARGCLDIPGFTPGVTYCVGAEFESEMETMPFEHETNFNSVQQLGRVKLRLRNSTPGFAYKGQHAARWETYDPARDHLTSPYTGAIRISQIPSPGVGQGFCLRADGAQDFALVSLTIEVDFHGK